MYIMQTIQPTNCSWATGSINTLHLKKQQKQAIFRSRWLFLCAKATRLLIKQYGSKCFMLPYTFKRHCYVLKLPCSRAEAAKLL